MEDLNSLPLMSLKVGKQLLKKKRGSNWKTGVIDA